MKIDDIRVSRATRDGGSAEVILRDDDGAEIRVRLSLDLEAGDERAAILDQARSLLVAAADAIGAPTAVPDAFIAANAEEVSLDMLDIDDGARPLESLEEDDDNAYQQSDEALPDERAEQALAAGLTRGRFGDPA